MSKKETVVEQAKLANMSDDELLNLIGYLWQEIKAVDEAMASDDVLKEMIEDLKDYKDDTYLTRKDAYKGQLKAARMLAKLANMSDDELRNLIGYLWQEIKAVDEAMASDDVLKEMIEDLKDYKDDTYLTRKDAYKGQLKAARMLAKQKGLRFTLPGEEK